MTSKRKWFLLFLVSLFILTSCAQDNVLNKIQLVTAIGIDLEEDDQLKGTASFLKYQKDGTFTVQTYSSLSKSKKDIWVKLDQQSPKKLLPGQLRSIIYGSSMAKERGLLKLTNAFYRDSNIPSTIVPCITDGQAMDIIKQKEKKNSTDAFLIHNILHHNMDAQNYPKMNLHTFAYDYYAEGKDPVLPLITLIEDEISLNGLALFKGDKYIASINPDNVFVFNMLLKNNGNASYQIPVGPKKEYLGFQNIETKRKIKIQKTGDLYRYFVKIQIEGFVTEYPERLNPSASKDIQYLESEVKKDVQTRLKEMVSIFQQKNIDPIGFGELTKNKFHDWKEKNFYKHYQNYTFDFDVNVKIKQTGGIE
jgi:spore germination protein